MTEAIGFYTPTYELMTAASLAACPLEPSRIGDSV